MSKNVNVNGKVYSGVSQIQLNTTDGVTALFQDVDEISASGGSAETGTFVGDGTRYATLPVTSKKQGVSISIKNANDEMAGADLTNNDIIQFTAVLNAPFVGVIRRWGSAAGMANNFDGDVYHMPKFNDASVVVDAQVDKFASGKTYYWEAW